MSIGKKNLIKIQRGRAWTIYHCTPHVVLRSFFLFYSILYSLTALSLIPADSYVPCSVDNASPCLGFTLGWPLIRTAWPLAKCKANLVKILTQILKKNDDMFFEIFFNSLKKLFDDQIRKRTNSGSFNYVRYERKM